MIHFLSKSAKRLLVALNLDTIVANKYHHSKGSFFKRLIPDRNFYKKDQIRNVIRDGVRFKVNPSDLSQWIIFADNNDFHVQAALRTINPSVQSIILDVGANCGQFSLAFGEQIRR